MHTCQCVTEVRTVMLQRSVRMVPQVTRQLPAWEDDHATRGTVPTGTRGIMEGHIIIDINSVIRYKSAPNTGTACGLSDCTSTQLSNPLVIAMQVSKSCTVCQKIMQLCFGAAPETMVLC